MWLEVPDLILLYTLFLLNMHMLFVMLWAIRFWHLVMWILWNIYHVCFGNRKRVSDILKLYWWNVWICNQTKTRMHAFWGYPRSPMFTRTIDQFILHRRPIPLTCSNWIPNENETKSVTNLTNLPKLYIFKFWKQLYTWNTWCGRDPVHRRTNGQGETSIPYSTSLSRGII